MFPSTHAVKKTALAVLKNEWPTAVLAVVIPLAFFIIMINLISFMLQIFTGVIAEVIIHVCFYLAMFFIGFPIMLGVLRIFWVIASEKDVKVYDVFYCFASLKSYKRFLHLAFLLLGRIVFRSFLLLLPSFIVEIADKMADKIFINSAPPLWFSNLWIFTFVFRTVAICGIVYIISRNYLAPFFFVVDDKAEVSECIKRAKMVSILSFGNSVALFFSMLGWVLLSLLFVPMIFTLPYGIMCYIIHSKYATVYHNSKIKTQRVVA